MLYEMTGILLEVGEVQSFGEKGFTKREFIIEAGDEGYKQKIKFELHKERTTKTDGIGVGENLRVSFSIRGSEWKDRLFINLVAFNVIQSKFHEEYDQSSDQPEEDYLQF